MNFSKYIKSLCTPAYIYFIISTLNFLAILTQNCSESHSYKIGMHTVKLPCHNGFFFIGKALYIAFWTFILQQLCKKGYSTVSWVLVLFPLIAMFIILGLIVVSFSHNNYKENMNIGMNGQTTTKANVNLVSGNSIV